MNPIVLDLPGSEIVFNNLYDTLSPDWLDEDLVFVRLSDGTRVDVGWHGEPGSGGFFKIVRYRSSWNTPVEVIRTSDVQEVAAVLRRLNERAVSAVVQGVPATFSPSDENAANQV